VHLSHSCGGIVEWLLQASAQPSRKHRPAAQPTLGHGTASSFSWPVLGQISFREGGDVTPFQCPTTTVRGGLLVRFSCAKVGGTLQPHQQSAGDAPWRCGPMALDR
jgi:hypothetical protein